MLYQIREAQRVVLNPLSDWAQAMSQLYNAPQSTLSWLPFAKESAAGFELLHRLGKEFEKPSFQLTETLVEGENIPIVEEIALAKPFCNLLKFNRIFKKNLWHHHRDPVVLIFAPMSGHYATLLRDTVKALLPNHIVYITDWMNARIVPIASGKFGLDDYIQYAVDFIRFLGPEVHLISVCQPTAPVLAGVSLMASLKDPHLPRSMTMMGGPIDTSASATAVTNLAAEHDLEWFERNLIYRVPARYPGVGRRVYPGFLQHAGFIAMNPSRHLQSYQDFYENLVKGDLDNAETHRRFYDEYNAVTDLPGHFYLETIKTIFQDQALPKGTWKVLLDGKTQHVRPADIREVALLTVEGEHDDISGPGQTRAAHDLCSRIPSSMQQHLTAEGVGHYGIFSGHRWRENIRPQIQAFIRRFHQFERRKNYLQETGL